MEAGSKLGHTMLLIDPLHCVSRIHGEGLGMTISGENRELDALLPRLGAVVRDFSLVVIRQAERMGIRVFNGFQSILLARNKFLTLQTLTDKGLPAPESYHSGTLPEFEQAVTALGGYPVVVKKLSSRQGKGVILVDSRLTAEFMIQNCLGDGLGLLIQRYIPPSGRRDIRAFVLGGQVIGAVELQPRRGDFRSNIHQRGRAKPTRLPKPLASMARDASQALGLEIAGVDMIIDGHNRVHVLEVNYSPGFKGLEAHTGLDIASRVIRYVAKTHGGEPWKSHF
jgi:ribosomal protein S6--L-glutamate ligase